MIPRAPVAWSCLGPRWKGKISSTGSLDAPGDHLRVLRAEIENDYFRTMKLCRDSLEKVGLLHKRGK